MKYPNITSVKAMEDYKIMFSTDTGSTKLFDVKPYIKGSWFGELSDINVFRTVRPCGETVEWEGGQDIAPHELHELSTVSER